MKLSDLRRILEHVEEHIAPAYLDPAKGPCWAWLGATDRREYGKVSISGKTEKVHRAVFQAMRGVALSPEQVLDHECRLRICCNPNHLAIVSSRGNTLRGVAARRAQGTLPLAFNGTRTGT